MEELCSLLLSPGDIAARQLLPGLNVPDDGVLHLLTVVVKQVTEGEFESQRTPNLKCLVRSGKFRLSVPYFTSKRFENTTDRRSSVSYQRRG